MYTDASVNNKQGEKDMRNLKKLRYIQNAGLKEVLEDAFSDTNEDEGFEYVIGKIFNGELKLVFEPNSDAFDSNFVDGVDGFGLCSVIEESSK